MLNSLMENGNTNFANISWGYTFYDDNLSYIVTNFPWF